MHLVATYAVTALRMRILAGACRVIPLAISKSQVEIRVIPLVRNDVRQVCLAIGRVVHKSSIKLLIVCLMSWAHIPIKM